MPSGQVQQVTHSLRGLRVAAATVVSRLAAAVEILTTKPEDGQWQLQLLCQLHPGLLGFQPQQTPGCGCPCLRPACIRMSTHVGRLVRNSSDL